MTWPSSSHVVVVIVRPQFTNDTPSPMYRPLKILVHGESAFDDTCTR